MLFILFNVEKPRSKQEWFRRRYLMGPANDVALHMIRQVMNSIWYRFSQGVDKLIDKNGINSSKAVEKRSCWSILSIDELDIDAKIIHKGRGKFEILEDNHQGKYIGKIVDASDVVRCKVEDEKAVRSGPVVCFVNKYCSICGYALAPQTYKQTKVNEDLRLRVIEEKHRQDIEAMREEMNQQFNQIMSMILQNYKKLQVSIYH
jgi:hypothetical protein